MRIYSKPSVRYCCWLWFHLATKQAACTDTERGKTPTVCRGPGEYLGNSTRVLKSTRVPWYRVRAIHVYVPLVPAGTQPSRPLPSSTLEPKAPLFIIIIAISLCFFLFYYYLYIFFFYLYHYYY